MAALLLALLLGLGVWQVQRAGWKAALLADYAARQAAPPLAELPAAAVADSATYRRVTLRGQFIASAAIAIKPRVRDGVLGYDQVVPFRLANGEVVLVLRGFRPETLPENTGAEGTAPQTIHASLRPFYPKGWMQPLNVPAKNQWYWLEPGLIAQHFGLPPLYPLLAVEDAAHFVLEIPNHHLLYAYTWFALAAAWLGVAWFKIKA